MDRLACVDVYALPLQLLLHAHPQWAAAPVVVVDEDKPSGVILWANEKARAHRILRGMRYSAGLSLARELRAGEVSEKDIAVGQKRIVRALRRYTPHIDAVRDGVFILDASGLKRLFPSLEFWARAMSIALKDAGFLSSIVVGFSRFHSFAVAQARLRDPIVVFADAEQERQTSLQVPLERILADAKARDALAKLGVNNVETFLALPEGGLRLRFGQELSTLWQLAAGQRLEPMKPVIDEVPVTSDLLLDEPEGDNERLLFLLKRLLHPMLLRLGEKSQALLTLQVTLELERVARAKETQVLSWQVAPAEATLDVTVLVELLRLRLSALEATLAAGVKSVRLQAEGVVAGSEQLALFRDVPLRKLRAAERSLARLRAEFGEASINRAVLAEGHLPEARFTWQPMTQLALPEPKPRPHRHSQKKYLVRRYYAKAVALPQRQQRLSEGWLLGGIAAGAVVKLLGPYVVSGGWWREELRRDYYFAEVGRGDWLWVFFDHKRRQWRQAGRVE